MKTAEIVDSIIVLATGGNPSADNLLWRSDIRALVGPVAKKAMLFAARAERDRTGNKGGGVGSIYSGFNKTVNVDMVLDEDRCVAKGAFPYSTVKGVGGGTLLVRGKGCGCDSLLFVASEQATYGMPDVPMAWIEQDAIFAKNISTDEFTVQVTGALFPTELDDDFDIPDELAVDVITEVSRLAFGQKQAIEDNVNDGNETPNNR
jgi:hypothetical protein